MLVYQTQLKKLILPEYGRNIQNMVDHCLTIVDRDERTLCARSIVAAMNVLFPAGNNSDPEAYRRKLWDHLMIMSDFMLDVDSPYDLIRPDQVDEQPDKMAYHREDELRWRHYGRYLPMMVEQAAAMPEGEERDALILLLANQMKKLMLAVNGEGVDDLRIFTDMYHLSRGVIRLDPENVHLHEFTQAVVPGKKKKKK